MGSAVSNSLTHHALLSQGAWFFLANGEDGDEELHQAMEQSQAYCEYKKPRVAQVGPVSLQLWGLIT